MALRDAFPLGTKVKLKTFWARQSFPGMVGKVGEVVGYGRNWDTVRIRFDGHKHADSWHRHFLVKVKR